jgi:hypothetical protein
MNDKLARLSAVSGFVLLAMTGCVAAHMDELKTASAGHTGCAPDRITISNHQRSGVLGSNETWNATCAGKVYLCSGIPSGKNSEEYSCAPAVQ